ncbi:NADH:flavin oxidoreductase [Mycolicibacterium phlei]|uniref:oxidoreductase n=1 Tax=Mycobacteroides chelonae TaxID=1774 RepID=UPI0007B45276|nr:NADH:flavin oxidoreductase [Mycobacteroides chelonae]ANA98501.1 NADH:flavin oxidoreductase [Mycobacteroides chelonae CCUG 47445]OLT72283.1 NADH:flavin oxidoreductase [Mycobacteroides chelonae]ORV11602.1 NADH:flavin oxidoreductase [Mycobacteroides chelonae]VEG16876.1 NADH:flavin oxidoreductase [Mycolicibacterium phlei]
MSDILNQPVSLPCGATLSNRIAKAGMSEQLAARDGGVTDELVRLYANWARSGAGLLITGNAVIDRTGLVEPRNVIVDSERCLPGLRRWVDTVHATGTTLWMQINHPGRVATVPFNRRPVGPAAVREPVPGFNLRRPRQLSALEVRQVIARYARSSELAVSAGFDGVQIHAAHGFLLSQFLSPLANTRTDQYGADAVGRRRMLLETVAAVRGTVGPTVAISVKLNAGDFQHGGFTEAESLDVARALSDSGIDLLEISGGNYAVPAMEGVAHRGRAATENGYFLSFATKVRAAVPIPLMLTGGIRTRAAMEGAVASGIDVVGIARPMAFVPDYPTRILSGELEPQFPSGPRALGYRPLDGYLQLAAHNHQFHRIAAGLTPQRAAGYGTVVKALARIGASGATQAVIPRRTR